MISAFSTQHKFQSKREETLLLQTDLSKANTVIPKPIQWKDINLPDEWILEGATAPVIPKQLEPNTKLQNVTQYSDDSDKKLKEPIFKSFQVSKTSQKLVHESKSDFAKAIREQLDRIEAYSSSSSKVQIAPDSAQSSKIGVLEQDNMSITSSDREAFKEEPVSKANKIHWELALPTVKSPPDLAIDNRPTNAYKTQLGTSDKAIAEILIAGFTGDPSHLRDKNAELLHNLRCRKLSEFQSYKTTFFTRLFLMDDANHITWKEKFLAGLPTLLEENVMNSIKALYDNRIPYDELTYGELVSFVNKEGLKICQDLKLQKRLKWELRKSKQELESSDSESSMTGDSEPLQVNELIDSYTSASSDSDSDTESYLKKINVLTKDQETFLELVKHITDPTLQKEYLDKLLKTLEGISPKQIMPPKQKDKGKGILKDPISQTPSKASQSSLPKEKLLSSSMPIKSWIDMVEEQEAQSKAIASQEQVNEWMKSISKSPELMLALQSISQNKALSPVPEEEKSVSKALSKPSSSKEIISCESSSSIIVSQSNLSQKSSDWFHKTHHQNVLSMEDEFYHSDPFQAISKIFPEGWFFKPWDLSKPQSFYQSILEIIESVKFKHFFLSESHTEPVYSTATILKVLSPKQWGGKMPKQSSLLSFPRDIKGSSLSRPLEESHVRTVASVSFDFSSNLDHHLTLKVLCRISWASIVCNHQDCGLGLVVGRDANGHRLQRGDKVENIKQKGGFRACTFVFVFSALENMGFIANGISMVLYFKNEMHFDLAGASNTLTNFFGSTFLLCLVGGFISDTFLSRFATCLIFGTLEVLALVMLTIQAYSKNLHPPDCGKSSCLKGAIAAYFYGSLYLYSLGCGGNRGTLPAFGAGQFDENDPKGAKALASYFNFYLLATTVAAVIGVTGIVYVFTEKSWWLGFLVSSVANFIGLIALAAGKRLYRIQQPDESPLVRVAQVLVVAIKNRKLSLPDNPEELYEINEKERASTWERIPHASQFRCLDKAAIMPKDSAVAAPWRVCTVTQVEEVKILTRMMPILASTILMNTCLAQLQTFSITQGAAMDPHLGSIKVPTSSIPVIPLLFMSILLPLYEFFFVPFARKITGHPSGITQLQRVGIGLVLSAVSMTVAGLVEVIRRNAFNQTPPKQISLFWLSFQYCIFGIADMFTFIGLLEFFYKEAPAGMKTLASSFTYLSLSFGYFLSSAFVDIINAVTKRITPSKQGWLHGKDINKNNVNLFYWFLAIVSVLNLVLYLYAAAWYKYKPENCSDIKPKPLMDPSAKEEKIDQDDGKAKQYGAASSDDGIIGKEKEFIHDEVKSQE
ncbi:hypothetical protein KPL71_017134 [Citrus sinensis]|uniref:Uncharacterized protein n=1 Tax=Citrus sinensis TaxID=2711 RepID=A0ACB8JMD9_CITSI|nr:hypothetical protein KPL71_017134 [Citrus sinensis]